uniref:Uncharacterized protein n=1 Tax=viral metagenome TaxID=1070528 RepID=A0A6C0F6I9_9ZZZZ|tara:strand:- start:616 stop:888 length:273 start_codon:yes stop_codon:yes gene_type:complete
MSKIVGSVSKVLNEKVVQVSLVGGILFFILANTKTFDMVQKLLEKVLGFVGFDAKLKGTALLTFHSVVYALLLWVVLTYVLQPVVKMIKN